MKIIFLDIDGVLNVIPKTWDKFGSLFHEHLVENLRNIIDKTGAKIVISSTWRIDGLNTMQMMWKVRNLPGEVIDITPTTVSEDVFILYPSDTADRGYEIQEWIDKNKPERYVIIDDDEDMLPHQMKYFVKTSENLNHSDFVDYGYGLTKECSELAIKILNE